MMKKIIYGVPVDIWIVMATTIIVAFSTDSKITGIGCIIFMVTYIAANLLYGKMKYGSYRYVLVFVPFFVLGPHITMSKGKLTLVKADGEPKKQFLRELCEVLKAAQGKTCTAITHKTFIRQIERRCEMVNAPKSLGTHSLKKELRILGNTEEKDVEFFFVKFRVK